MNLFPVYHEIEFVRVECFGDEIDRTGIFKGIECSEIKQIYSYALYATNPFIAGQEKPARTIKTIEEKWDERLNFLKK